MSSSVNIYASLRISYSSSHSDDETSAPCAAASGGGAGGAAAAGGAGAIASRDLVTFVRDYLEKNPCKKAFEPKSVSARKTTYVDSYAARNETEATHHLFLSVKNFEKLCANRVLSGKSWPGYPDFCTAASMTAIDLHVALEAFFNTKIRAASSKPREGDLKLTHKLDDLCTRAGVTSSIGFLEAGASANIWARYPISEYQKAVASGKTGKSVPALLRHLYTLRVITSPKDLRTEVKATQEKIAEIISFFQTSIQETFGLLASDTHEFKKSDLHRLLTDLNRSTPSDPALRTVDPLAAPKILLDAKIREEFSHEHNVVGFHLDNIFQYMDWLTTALSVDEKLELPPSEVYEWLRNLIGGLDKSFEELFVAAIHHYKKDTRVDGDLLTGHDNLAKIRWLAAKGRSSLSLTDEEIALIKKINIGNALQYTNRTEDEVDPTVEKTYAILLKETLKFATSYVGVASGYSVKTRGKEIDFSSLKFNQKEILTEADTAIKLWMRLANELFPTPKTT